MDELHILLSKLREFQQQKELQRQHILAVAAGQDQDKALQKKLKLLEATIGEQHSKHKKADSTNKQRLKSLLADIDTKTKVKAAKERLIATLQDELAHLSMEKRLVRDVPNSELKTKQLEMEEAFSTRHLALEIKKVKGGWLQFVFTNINRQKPELPYCFSLQIDENRKYIVGKCQPEVADMEMLTEKLNATNNLSVFVHSVRKRFTDMVGK
ncbi:hypothetical protein BsWGS_04129 [Bradybaena similaris]